MENGFRICMILKDPAGYVEIGDDMAHPIAHVGKCATFYARWHGEVSC